MDFFLSFVEVVLFRSEILNCDFEAVVLALLLAFWFAHTWRVMFSVVIFGLGMPRLFSSFLVFL